MAKISTTQRRFLEASILPIYKSVQRFIKSKALVMEVLWICVGQALVASGGIASVKILTSKLSPAFYGEFALAITVSIFVQQMLLGPLNQAALRFYAVARESGTVAAFVKALMGLALGACGIVVLIAIPVFALIIASRRTELLSITATAVAIALVCGLNIVVDGLQTGARRRAVVALHQGAAQWLRPGLALGFIVLFGPKASTALLGYLIASCLVLGSELMTCRATINNADGTSQKVETNRVLEFRKDLIAYSWPYAAWGLFTALQLTSDRWALTAARNASIVGIFVVAYQLGYQPISLILNAGTQFIAPILFDRAGHARDSRRVNSAVSLNMRLIGITGVVSIVCALFAYAVRHWIVALLCPPAYADAARFIPWLVLGAGLFGCGQMASQVLLIHFETRMLILPKAVTAIAATALSLVGAQLAGVGGVVTVNVLFGLAYSVWIFRLTGSPCLQNPVKSTTSDLTFECL